MAGSERDGLRNYSDPSQVDGSVTEDNLSNLQDPQWSNLLSCCAVISFVASSDAVLLELARTDVAPWIPGLECDQEHTDVSNRILSHWSRNGMVMSGACLLLLNLKGR